MDSKLVIIYGKGLVDEKNRDGEIEFLGKLKDDSRHSAVLKEYFQDNFKGFFSKETIDKMFFISPEMVAYYLTKLGHIVFFNTMRPDTIKNYGKTGFFMMPDIEKISEKQKESLLNFATTIDDFKVEIGSSLKLIDNSYLESKTLRTTSSIKTVDIVNIFLTTKEEVENKQK